eukprot:366377-Chlamydomonas_euryale.AAC.10
MDSLGDADAEALNEVGRGGRDVGEVLAFDAVIHEVEDEPARDGPGVGLVWLLGAIHEPAAGVDDAPVVDARGIAVDEAGDVGERAGVTPVARDVADEVVADGVLHLWVGDDVRHDDVPAVLEGSRGVVGRGRRAGGDGPGRGLLEHDDGHVSLVDEDGCGGDECLEERLDVSLRVRPRRRVGAEVDVDDDGSGGRLALHHRNGPSRVELPLVRLEHGLELERTRREAERPSRGLAHGDMRGPRDAEGRIARPVRRENGRQVRQHLGRGRRRRGRTLACVYDGKLSLYANGEGGAAGEKLPTPSRGVRGTNLDARAAQEEEKDCCWSVPTCARSRSTWRRFQWWRARVDVLP